MHRVLMVVAPVALLSMICAGVVGSALARGLIAHASMEPSPTVSVTTLPQLPTMPPTEPTYPPSYQASPTPGGVIAPAGTVIQVVGDVAYPKVYTLKDLQQMRRSSVTLRVLDRDGKWRLHIFSGVLLRDLITAAAPTAPGGSTVSTKAYALIEGVNGDSALIAFPEFEAAFNNKQILVAYDVDGAPLAGQAIGELVVPEDQTQGRFVTGVSTIRISSPAP